MISKTNGLIDYMNKQHKGYSMMEEHFTYDLPSGNLISFFLQDLNNVVSLSLLRFEIHQIFNGCLEYCL